MRTVIAALSLVVALHSVACLAVADSVPGDVSTQWLMLVGTRNTDPTQDVAFNKWYDDIDIPDVLKVPGYRRARRGLRQNVSGSPASALPRDEGPYVALYDIETQNIDRTIIDMLMAARKMDATGRSTDLLESCGTRVLSPTRAGV